jgi:hypothetical protein
MTLHQRSVSTESRVAFHLRPTREPAHASKHDAWDRWAPTSGLVFVALALAAWLLFIGAPGVDGSDADAASFVQGHRRHLLLAGLLTGLALMAFLVFLGSLFTCVRAAGELELGVVAVGAGLVSGMLFVLIGAIPAALAFAIATTTEPDVVKAIYDLVWPLQVLIAFPASLLVGAISAASLRSNIFPKPIAWAGVGSAIAILVGGTTWSQTGHWSPSHGYQYVALFVFLSWVVVTSVLQVRNAREARAVGQRRAPASG